jgi:hypothetical protein
MTLQICTFKWGSKYTVEHVVRLRNMLARNLTIPWQLTLLTDNLEEDAGGPAHGDGPSIRVLPLWEEMRDAKLCGVRLRAFGRDMAQFIGPRFAWVDLDVAIVANVDHIFSRPEPFIALATPQGPLAYNGSLVMMDAGAREYVYQTWNRQAYARLPTYYEAKGMRAGGESDEGWMTLAMGDKEPTFNGGWGKRTDGIYFFRKDLQGGRLPLPKNASMVIMNGRAFDPSFADLQRRCSWLREAWR